MWWEWARRPGLSGSADLDVYSVSWSAAAAASLLLLLLWLPLVTGVPDAGDEDGPM